MLKITLGVDGMMCGMCESHVNDAVRKAFPVKKVTSSHGKGQTVILTEQDLDEHQLTAEQSVRDRKALHTCAEQQQYLVLMQKHLPPIGHGQPQTALPAE